MFQKNPPPILSAVNVAEFLADREGLVGGARARFRRVLQEYGGFHEKPNPTNLSLPILVSSILALIGITGITPFRWAEGVALTAYVFLAVGLLLFRHRLGRRNRSRGPDHETDWEAYCLFLRPIILNEHPGLLDRNKKYDHRSTMLMIPTPAFTWRSSVHEPSLATWWSAMGGLWGGMATAVATHQVVTAVHELLPSLIVFGGMLLGLAFGMIGRRIVYVIVKWHLHRLGP